MFWFLLAVFVVILGFLLYAAFWRQNQWLTETILGVFDGLIAWTIKHLVLHLFPPQAPTKN